MMQVQSDKPLRTRRKRKIQKKIPGESPLFRTTHVSCPPSVSPLRENMICDVWRARKWYVQHFFFTFRNPGKRVEMFLHKHFLWTGMGWTFTLSGGDVKHVKLFFYQILCRFEPQAWTKNFQMFKLVLEKAEEPEIKLPTSTGSLKKEENSKKISISSLLTTPKPLTVWIKINCGKFWKR